VTDLDEVTADLSLIDAALRRIEQADPDEWDEDTAILVWDLLDQFTAFSRMVAFRHASLLAKRVPTEYEHPTVGKVHVDTDSKVKWDGASVLSALSIRMADTETGDIMDAVPTDTLRKVLPAVKPGNTSSRWNKSGLTAAGIQPGMYCETEWGAKVLRRGPKYRR